MADAREAGGQHNAVPALDALHHSSHLEEIMRLTAWTPGPVRT